MKRVVIRRPREVEIEECEPPAVRAGHILVRTRVTGISCGTEMILYRGSDAGLRKTRSGFPPYPRYPGYEAVGNVVELGAGVAGLQLGDRVVCHGPHAEYVSCHKDRAIRLPDTISDECATLAILATTGQHAIHRSGLQYGDTVAVLGLGVLGLLVLQHCRLAGSRCVIGLDVQSFRRARAADLGADVVINPAEEDAEDIVREVTGIGADVVFEVTGAASGVQQALTLARDGGRIIVLGVHTQPVPLPLGEDFHWKELEIRASGGMGGPATIGPRYLRWNEREGLSNSVRLMEKGALVTEPLVTHRFPADEIAHVYKCIDRGMPDALQIVLDWHSKRREENGAGY